VHQLDWKKQFKNRKVFGLQTVCHATLGTLAKWTFKLFNSSSLGAKLFQV